MGRQTKPAAGGIRSAGRKDYAPSQSSTARLTWALRTHRWPPEEAAALARRRGRAELCHRHLSAAAAAWGRDESMCRWHAERMAELRRGGCHG